MNIYLNSIDWVGIANSGPKRPSGWTEDTDFWLDEIKDPIDYAEKQLFPSEEDALNYAHTLKWWVVSFNTKFNQWEVEVMDGPRG